MNCRLEEESLHLAGSSMTSEPIGYRKKLDYLIRSRDIVPSSLTSHLPFDDGFPELMPLSSTILFLIPIQTGLSKGFCIWPGMFCDICPIVNWSLQGGGANFMHGALFLHDCTVVYLEFDGTVNSAIESTKRSPETETSMPSFSPSSRISPAIPSRPNVHRRLIPQQRLNVRKTPVDNHEYVG
jgi:hypothetical protein